MAQLFSFSAQKARSVAGQPPRGDQPLPVDPEARDIGHTAGPETPLTVEFVGINASQQQAALRAFPGGKRFQLASVPPEVEAKSG